jgi:short-subunit dehydrogenase
VRRYVVDGGTAVLTGAASGIGHALALELSRRGSHLVLLDRDAEGLAAVAAQVREGRPDRTVTTHVVDLADRSAALATAHAVCESVPHVSLLVNNAGVALTGRLDQVSLEDVEWVLDVNLRAVVLMTHTLLPALASTPGAHVVNVSSLFGLIAPPGQIAYATSKFGVRGFSEGLRLELLDRGVGVTTVHPGGIATNIGERARQGFGVSAAERAEHLALSRRLLHIDPSVAARRIVDGVERRKARVLIGFSAYALDLVARALPASYGRLLLAAYPLRARADD